MSILRDHPVVSFVGSRGSGKAQLLSEVTHAMQSAGWDVERLDCGSVGTEEDQLSIPSDAAAHLDRWRDRVECGERGLLLLADAHRLLDRAWASALQSVARSVVAEYPGTARILIAGRPTALELLGGDSSPLVNMAYPVWPRPLSEAEVSARFGLTPALVKAIVAWTGGNRNLVAEVCGYLELDNGANVTECCDLVGMARATWLTQVVADHGSMGLRVVTDLYREPRGLPVSDLVAGLEPSTAAAAQDRLRQMVGTGLIAEDHGTYRLGARALKHDSVREAFRLYADQQERFVCPIHAPAFHLVAAQEIYELENALRQIVMDVLIAESKDWWDTCLPSPEMRANADARYREAVDAEPGLHGQHPIMFLDFADLFEIMRYSSNLKLFQRRMPRLDRPTLDETARTLRRIRNAVAHNRPISRGEYGRLLTLSHPFGSALEARRQHPTAP